MFTFSGYAYNYAGYKVRQLMNIEGELQERNNEAIILIYVISNTGCTYEIPITKYDLMTYKSFNLDTTVALARDNSRVITAKEKGKSTLKGYGSMRVQ